MNKFSLITTVFFLLTACSGESTDSRSVVSSSLEVKLSANTTWPYEVTGVLDIVEAGGYEDSNYPSWAVGSLLIDGDTTGVAINIGEGVVSRAGVDIDSGKKVRVWLNAPKIEHGVKVYEVSKIEALQ